MTTDTQEYYLITQNTKYVKCINNINYEDRLTINNIYKVMDFFCYSVVVVDDLDEMSISFPLGLFISVDDQDEMNNLSKIEDQKHYPINKDNIVEVLEYNGIDKSEYLITASNISILSVQNNVLATAYFINNHWIQVIEVYLGKLKPLPKPKFDFVRHLIAIGFKASYSHPTGDKEEVWKLSYNQITIADIKMVNGIFQHLTLFNKQYSELDKKLANTLIQVAKLAAESSS